MRTYPAFIAAALALTLPTSTPAQLFNRLAVETTPVVAPGPQYTPDTQAPTPPTNPHPAVQPIPPTSHPNMPAYAVAYVTRDGNGHLVELYLTHRPIPLTDEERFLPCDACTAYRAFYLHDQALLDGGTYTVPPMRRPPARQRPVDTGVGAYRISRLHATRIAGIVHVHGAVLRRSLLNPTPNNRLILLHFEKPLKPWPRVQKLAYQARDDIS